MIGLEQTVIPLIGKDIFGIESNAIILSFIASFGLAKALLNLYAGALGEKESVDCRMAIWHSSSFLSAFCPWLELDNLCKCTAGRESGFSMVNDS
jgi:hypothetical protein